MTVVFWLLVFLILYTYIGYPLVLWTVGKIRRRDVQKRRINPSVSIIIAARNEANKIREKVRNTLGLHYPKESLEVLVASDASDDGTDEIVGEYVNERVRLVRAPERKGKEYAQGLAVAVAMGEVLVFTDAAAMLEPDALTRLVENFADPTVGAASTEDVLVDAAGAPNAEGVYVKYEMWVRRLESRFHSLVGLSGSCFAVRRELCVDWSLALASDFMVALRAARGGYRSIADPSARARFVTVASADLEMPRKIRTFLRGITVVMANLGMSNPFRYGRFAFQLVSHKLLRFLAPFVLLAILATSGLLVRDQPFQVLFFIQAGFYTLGIVGSLVTALQRNWIIRVIYYFSMVQGALLVAWAKYALGHHQIAWEPSRRPGIPAAEHGSSP